MISEQTSQVLMGAVVAVIYAGSVITIGSWLLTLLMSRWQATAVVRARLGRIGFLWLGFVMGQGILGFLWLVLALAGIFESRFVWMVCSLGWLLVCGKLYTFRWRNIQRVTTSWRDSSFKYSRSWYVWLGIGALIVALLHGVTALLPPWVDDALKHYLVWAKLIAFNHKLELQPSLHPFYGLLPMQVEMHWAALFAISHESAITVWDYLCAVSFLCGIGLLAWSLTASRRVALLAVVMMLSTPAFYSMMGGGKIDNAGAQYGIAASLWLVVWPVLGRRAALAAGLCIGWALASRYTNVILLPGLILLAIMGARYSWKEFSMYRMLPQAKRYWTSAALVAGIAAGLAGVPMLIKNWLLVGCPLAPQFGCRATSWQSVYRVYTSNFQNLSVSDLLFYPFVWTFGIRDSMLGNISPLFLGFFPFLLAYRRFSIMKSSLIAGFAGLVSIMAWIFIEPLVLFTRFLLVPLALLTVPLSAAIVAAEQDLRQHFSARLIIRGAIALVLFFLLFESRGTLYAGRYIASIDTRSDWYQSRGDGYDVAAWLNRHVRPGERVALGNFKGHRYFVEPNVLLNAESTDEFQWLWDHGHWLYGGSGSITPLSWISDFWRFYAERGFTYIVIAKNRVDDALSAWPSDMEGVRVQVAAVGQANTVLKIEKQ